MSPAQHANKSKSAIIPGRAGFWKSLLGPFLCRAPTVDSVETRTHALSVIVSQENPQVRFEQDGARLTAIEITREQRSPVIAVLQRTLFALGIVVSSYQARAKSARLVERIVIERTDGGSIDGALSIATQAAILPIALSTLGAGPASRG